MNSTPASELPTHWTDPVAYSGESGEAWIRMYRAYPDLERLGGTVLTALRRRDIVDGAAKLKLLRTIWEQERPRAILSIQGVIDRWFYGVEGYYHYVVEEYSRASELMTKTNDAVIAAVSSERALLPLAHQSHELALHQARIARNQGRWKKMEEIVDEVAGDDARRSTAVPLARRGRRFLPRCSRASASAARNQFRSLGARVCGAVECRSTSPIPGAFLARVVPDSGGTDSLLKSL